MLICISSSVIGGPGHLLVDIDAGISNIISTPLDELSDDIWILDVVLRRKNCLRTCMSLAGINIKFPGDNYITAMHSLGMHTDIPWWQVMPKTLYRDALRDIIRDTQDVLKSPIMDYYRQTFCPSRDFLWDLSSCHVDESRIQNYITQGAGNIPALRSFDPIDDYDDSTALPIIYDVLGGRTGRLKVESGPQILTLLRDHRNVIKSRWSDGMICYFDYVSLEARIALYEGGVTPPDDIYDSLANGILGGVTRSAAKIAVLSAIYGSGEAMLDGLVEPGTASWVLQQVKDYFNVAEVTARLREDYDICDGITNKYGRQIPCLKQDHLLYNSFVQSTGVDTALLGFSNMLKCMPGVVPLAILHDALIVDIPAHQLTNTSAFCAVGSCIPGFDIAFPMKMTPIK